MESDKQRAELDHARALREKDSVVDQIRNQNLVLNQSLHHSDDEVKTLQIHVRELQAKNATLNAKRQSESEQVQETFRQ